MPDIERPARANCTRHNSGHTPHAIQVRLSQQSPPEDWQRVVVLGAEGAEGDIVVLAVDGVLHRYRNHEPAVLLWTVGQVGAEAMLNTEYRALFCLPWPDGGSSVFSLQDADAEPLPCVPRP